MKTVSLFSILCPAIAWSPFCAELTETDLENIRQIFREEWEKPITNHIDTIFREIEARLAGIDTRFDGINWSLDRIQMMLWIATVLVVGTGLLIRRMF